jgi:hypothetical protein
MKLPRVLNVVMVTALALLVSLWLRSRWQPARQARVHTEKLLSAVESKDWSELSRLMANDYTDTWGNEKADVLERVREVFAQFFAPELKAGPMTVETMDGRVVVRAPVSLRGRGGPMAEVAVQRVGALREPFVFTWRKESWRPWDWVLTRVEQPELKVESW